MNPGPLPTLPDDCYPPDAETIQPQPLVERRPGFSLVLGDTVRWGHDEAIDEAVRRAQMTGVRQIVTRCYDDATRRAKPLLRRAWIIQAQR